MYITIHNNNNNIDIVLVRGMMCNNSSVESERSLILQFCNNACAHNIIINTNGSTRIEISDERATTNNSNALVDVQLLY